MTPISSFTPYVAISCRGASDPVIEWAVLYACKQLCERTLVWRYEPSDVALVYDTQTYTPTIPDGTLIAGVHELWHVIGSEERQLHPASPSELVETLGRWRAAKGSHPERFVLEDPDILQVVPAVESPNTLGVLKMVLALAPTDNATDVDDNLFSRYRDIVIEGAKAALYGIPEEPWTNERLASLCEDKFKGEILRIRTKVIKGNTNVSRGARAREFGF